LSDITWQLLVVLLLIGVVLEGLVLIGVMRQVGGILVRMQPLGAPGGIEGGPEIESVVEVPGVEDRQPAILLFLAPGCGLCDALIGSLPVFQKSYPDVQLVAVPGGDSDEREFYAAKLDGIARSDLFYLYGDWNITGTPFAVGLDRSLTVRSTGVVNNLEHLEGLAALVLQEEEVDRSIGLEVGLTSSRNGSHLSEAGLERRISGGQ
jgi:thiol-disulfide isomerase/thioredoxin